MSGVKDAVRLIHCTILKEFRTVRIDAARGWYDCGSGAAVIVDYDRDRFDNVHETFSIGDGNHEVRITVRNSDVAEPQDHEAVRRRLRLMLHDLCDGTTDRLTRMQKRRMEIVRRLASLWTDAPCGASLTFHPRTSLSGGWVEHCMDIPTRAHRFSDVAKEIVGEQRRARMLLRGDGRTYDAEARPECGLVRPIPEPLIRLREICSLREEAAAIGVEPTRLDAIMVEARL
jgi:hypothetical protein